jgi:hypothetical protein
MSASIARTLRRTGGGVRGEAPQRPGQDAFLLFHRGVREQDEPGRGGVQRQPPGDTRVVDHRVRRGHPLDEQHLLAGVVSALRRLLTANRLRRTIDALMGTLLVGLGVRMATTCPVTAWR